MDSVLRTRNTKAWIAAAAAVVFAGLFTFSMRASRLAAEQAVRLYGHNVDSGAYEYMAGLLYLAPGAILFLLAAVALFKHWRSSGFLYGIAWGWIVLPFVAIAALWLSSLVAG
jgi:hypothetical protein